MHILAEIITQNPTLSIGGLLAIILSMVKYYIVKADKREENRSKKIDELIKVIAEMREAQVKTSAAMEAIAKSTTDLGKTLEAHVANTKVHIN